MASNARLRLKAVPTDIWSLRERLALACSVMRSGDQNWVSVSRAIKPFSEPDRSSEWFSQRNCALQYSDLLEKVQTPKRKRGEREVRETPGDVIVRKLTIERIEQLKRIVQEEETKYKKLKQDVEAINCGLHDAEVKEKWEELENQKRAAQLAQETAAAESATKAKATVSPPGKLKRTPPANLKLSIEGATTGVLPLDENTEDSFAGSIATTTGEESSSSVITASVESPQTEDTASNEAAGNEQSGNEPATITPLVAADREEVCEEATVEEEDMEKEEADEGEGVECTENAKQPGGGDIKTEALSPDNDDAASSQGTAASSVTPTSQLDVTSSRTDVTENDVVVVVPGGEVTEVVSEIKPRSEVVTPSVEVEENPSEDVSKNVEMDIVVELSSVEEVICEDIPVEVETKKEQPSSLSAGVTEEDEHGTEAEGTQVELQEEEAEAATEKKEDEDEEEDEIEEVVTPVVRPPPPPAVSGKLALSSVPLDSEEPVSPASSAVSAAEMEETTGGKSVQHSRTGGKAGVRRNSRGQSKAGRPSRRLTRSKLVDEKKDSEAGSHVSDTSDDEAHTPLGSDDQTSSSAVKYQLTSGIESLPNSPSSITHSDTEDERAHKTWKRSIMLVWRSAANHKYANVFLHPVTEEIAPGYLSVVFRPMDLYMIKKNIESGVIRTTSQFQRDMMLMFTNAIMYNNSDHNVHHMAVVMYNDVMLDIEQYVNTQMLVQTETKVLRTSRRSDVTPVSDKEDEVKKKRTVMEHEAGGKAKKRRA